MADEQAKELAPECVWALAELSERQLAPEAARRLGGAVRWRTGDPRIAPAPEPRTMVVAPADAARALDDLAILMAQPPVPALDRPQARWLAVLVETSEGDR